MEQITGDSLLNIIILLSLIGVFVVVSIIVIAFVIANPMQNFGWVLGVLGFLAIAGLMVITLFRGGG